MAPPRTRIDTDAVLDTLKTASTLLANVADGPVNIPILKGAASLAREIITIAQTVRNNKSDCLELAGQVAEYMTVIVRTHHRSGAILPEGSFDGNMSLLQDELEGILRLLKKVASKRLLRRAFFYEKDKRSIDTARQRLQHAFSRFHLAASVVVQQELRELDTNINDVRSEIRRAASDVGADVNQISLHVLQIAAGMQRFGQGIGQINADIHALRTGIIVNRSDMSRSTVTNSYTGISLASKRQAFFF